jgi:hypothetical protein
MLGRWPPEMDRRIRFAVVAGAASAAGVNAAAQAAAPVNTVATLKAFLICPS